MPPKTSKRKSAALAVDTNNKENAGVDAKSTTNPVEPATSKQAEAAANEPTLVAVDKVANPAALDVKADVSKMDERDRVQYLTTMSCDKLEFQSLSKRQFFLINQMTKLMAEARVNEEKLQALCPHGKNVTRVHWSHDDERSESCMCCTNHSSAFWINTMYKNSIYDLGTGHVFEHPPAQKK